MLKIRLIRMGRRNRPHFRLVLTEGQRSVKSTYLELLGSFDPRNKKNTTVLKEERIKQWLKSGAQLSATAHNILVDRGIISGPKQKATKHVKKKAAESQSPRKERTEGKASSD